MEQAKDDGSAPKIGETDFRRLAGEAGWKPEDIDWLIGQVRDEFKQIALRYGRLCFSLCMQAGMVGGAGQRVQQAVGFCQSRHVKDAGLQALDRIIVISNDFVVKILKDNGIDIKVFHECKKEIETTGSLIAGAQGVGAVAERRIILPS